MDNTSQVTMTLGRSPAELGINIFPRSVCEAISMEYEDYEIEQVRTTILMNRLSTKLERKVKSSMK